MQSRRLPLPAGVKLCAPPTTPATRRRWLELRRNGIGASETAAVLGMHPYVTQMDVWLDKHEVTKRDAGEAATWGRRFEHPIALEVAHRHPHLGRIAASPGLLRHDEHDWLLATPDRILFDPYSKECVGLLEIKTVGPHVYEREWVNGNAPDYVLVQVQQQLAVTGLSTGWVAVLVAGQRMPPPIHVARDESAIRMIVDETRQWWRVHVEQGDPPEATYRDVDAISHAFSADEEAVTVTDDELTAQIEALRAARQAQSQADRAVKKLVADIGLRMLESTSVVDSEGRTLLTYREQIAQRLSTDAVWQDFPEVAAKCMRPVPSRVMRVTKEAR